MTTDDRGVERFEDRLREALAADRPALGAPAGLRARVIAIPGARRRAWLGLARRWGPFALSGAAAAACAVLWLSTSLRPAGSGGGPTGTATTSVPWDPTTSVGVTTGVVPTLVIVPGVVAVIAGLLALRLALRWWRRQQLGPLVRAVPWAVIAATAIWLATQPGFAQGSFSGRGDGVGIEVEPAPGTTDALPTWYLTASPGDPFVVELSIRNSNALPITFEGLVEDDHLYPTVYHWSSVWLTSDPTYFGFTDHARPFTPTVVQPGDELAIFLIGRTGTCAVGPSFSVATPPANVGGYTNRGSDVRLAYSILGLQSTATVALREVLIEPVVNPCVP